MIEITLTPEEALALKRLQKFSGSAVDRDVLCSLDQKKLIVATDEGWSLTFMGYRAFKRRSG